MRIIDSGGMMKLTNEERDITPWIARITYNEGKYFCKDKMEVRIPAICARIDVNINFCINEETEDLNGPVYNDYFRNVDYISTMNNYQNYKTDLENRVRKDYVRNKRNEFNSTKNKHWRFRK